MPKTIERGFLADPVLSLLQHAPCRHSYVKFLEHIGRDDRGEKLVIDPLTRFMGVIYTACFLAHVHISEVGFPGLGKSTRARLFALWCLGNDIPLKMIAVSADKSVSRRTVTFLRDMIANNELGASVSKFREIFPEVVPDNERNRLHTTKGWRMDEFFIRLPSTQSADATMEAVAALPKGEARRIGLGIFDDMMTRMVAESRQQRDEHFKSLISTFIEGRLKNPHGRGGWALVMQNCWHKDDAAHRLLKDHRFCSVWVGVDVDCDALFIRVRNAPDFDVQGIAEERAHPEGWADREFRVPLPPGLSVAELQREAREPATRADFRRMKRLIALSDEDRMFPSWNKRKRFDGTVSEMLGCESRAGLPYFEDIHNIKYTTALGIDIGGMKRRGDSITCLGQDRQGMTYPIACFRGAFTIKEIMEFVHRLWMNNIRFGIVAVENNATQIKIVGAIKEDAVMHGYPWWGAITGFQTGANKIDPSIGLPAMEVMFDNQAFTWPEDEETRTDVAHASAWAQWNTEMMDCPRLFGPTDDTPDSPMSMWFAWDALRGIPAGRRYGLKTEGVTKSAFRPGRAEGIL